jgi:hypothetical protein
VEGIGDLDVLDVWDSILGIAEMFHVVPKTSIMLLLKGLYCKRMLVCTLEVPDEHGTQLVPIVDGSLG